MKNILLRASTRLRAAAHLAPRVLVSVGREQRPQAFGDPATGSPEGESSAIQSSNHSTSNQALAISSHVIKLTGTRRLKARAIAKDTLLLSLEGLAQSADAFPPLKSTVGGLLFLANQVERVTSNKEQIEKMYSDIDAFAASLERAISDATTLSPALEAAIYALEKDVNAMCADMEGIRRGNWFLRFLRAKRHSAELQGFARRLDQAINAFFVTMSTSTEMKTTEILASVQRLREDVLSFRRWAQLFFLRSLLPNSGPGQARADSAGHVDMVPLSRFPTQSLYAMRTIVPPTLV